jgi:alpha-glucosidase
MADAPWWRGAVVYQVYVRSFMDSDGDGHGDLPGLISRLDYIKSLGVNAIWLSPIHPSPNRDWGYDVSDYEGVHPDYGTLADFDALLAAAHACGIKVLLDEVLAHTSDEHPWFQESLRGRDNPKSDWYVWAETKPDGTPPNNWLAAFGGPGWSYQPARRQHFHHRFLRQQPKLNWHNPDARQAALDVLDFWLRRGADGFRLDTTNCYLHDPLLADNPPEPMESRTRWHWGHAAHLQRHLHDSNRPDNITAMEAVRRTVERHPDRFVFGEFFEEPALSGGLAAPDEGLHSGYSFPLLIASELERTFLTRHYQLLSEHADHWPCIAFSNHDIVRTVTRFGRADAGPKLARMMLALLLSLRGTILLYQGEELGLPEADLTRDQLRDPMGDLYYPVAKGRDGCRTPMPWTPDRNFGFTIGTPWLPAAKEHVGLSVAEQEADPDSPLNFARRLVKVRSASPALRLGALSFIDAPAPILAYERREGDERIVCVFNLSAAAVDWKTEVSGETLAATGEVDAEAGAWRLGPYAAAIVHTH